MVQHRLGAGPGSANSTSNPAGHRNRIRAEDLAGPRAGTHSCSTLLTFVLYSVRCEAAERVMEPRHADGLPQDWEEQL